MKRLALPVLAILMVFSRSSSAENTGLTERDAGLFQKHIQEMLTLRQDLSATQELHHYLQWHADGAELPVRWLEAIDEREKSVLDNPESGLEDRLYAQGYVNFFNGDPTLATQAWEKFLHLAQGDPDRREQTTEVADFLQGLKARLAAHKGLEAEKQKNFQEAERWLALSLRYRPDDTVRQSLDQVTSERERLAAQRETTLKEKRVQKLLQQGRRLYDRGDREGARLALLQAQALRPLSPEEAQLLLLAETARAPFDPEKAKEYYEEGLKAYARGQLTEAKTLWQTAARLDPHFTPVQKSLQQLESLNNAKKDSHNSP